MPIFHNRIADQVEELLPDFYQKDGPRFVSFIKSYFEYLEKGQLFYKEGADIDYIGLEDETIAGEANNISGERGNLLQEVGTYAPSSVTSAKFNYEIDIDSGGVQKTSFEKDEFVVGSTTGAIGRIDVIGTSSNLYIEQFSEAQFDIDETITGKTSEMTAKVASFKASPLQAANNLLSYADVDKTSGDFLEYFRRDFMPFIDRDVLANKRLLQKHVQELYLSKGSKESYEFLFRILYGLEAEVSFPGDNVIKPSESEYSEPTVMRLFSEKDLTVYKRGLIRKFDSTGAVIAESYINDASGMSGTNDIGNAYELELILPYVGTFNSGDSVVLSDRDGFRIDAPATVRGVMTDISTTESSIYLGQEDGNAGDIDDILRVESATAQYMLEEGGGKLLFEDDDEMVFEHGIGGQFFQARATMMEDGQGMILSESSLYNETGTLLLTDYAILDENTDLFDLDPTQSGTPDSRTMSGGLYSETLSSGSLFTESDVFNYNSPAGGIATQSINVIKATGRGGVTDIVIDDVGQGYSANDMMVFINTGTDGNHAEAIIAVTDGQIELETASAEGVFEFTGTGSKTVFSGRDLLNRTMGFDPRNVHVFVNNTEIARTTGFTTDQSGQQITFLTAPINGTKVVIHAFNRGVLLEDSLRPSKLQFKNGVLKQRPVFPVIASETKGSIRKLTITNEGLNYKSLPQVFMGGYIYYDKLTTGTKFSVGEVITESGGNGLSSANISMIVAEHDLDKKRLTAYKRSTDTSGVPSGTITGSTSGASFTLIQTNMTAGLGAKLFAYSDDIGSIEKLEMLDVGHNFIQGGIGNYKQHAILRDVSANPLTNTRVTAALTGATGTVRVMNGDLNMLTLENVQGIFNDGDYCTTDDGKSFYIGRTNACTARGSLGGTALVNGNYLDDRGFPSATSMRIHDSYQYQDFSYKIKVGKSINDYRSLIKSLLSPAGTIFFGEVSIKNQVDGSAKIYDHNYDGTETTRSFIPTLIIGSKIDTADIELESGTNTGEDSVFVSYDGRVQLETEEGILTTERFLSVDANTVKDQSSGQPYILGTDTVEEFDRDFFNRQLTAEAGPKGHKVTKELDISPHYNQHKLYYSTLDNTLAVGTKVRGTTSNALGIVIEHDTVNKFIILHRQAKDYGQAGSQFQGDEIIKNTAQSTTYFTTTSIELHHTPEVISSKKEPTTITADSSMISANQKISNTVEGGADAYDHTDYISGFAGRGKVLTTADHNETYDSEMRQRKVNIISSPLFTESATQRGRTFTAGVKQIRAINTQTSRTLGTNDIVTNLTGTALRIDSAFNTVTTDNNRATSFNYRPAGQKLYEINNFESERLMAEDGSSLIFEPQPGRIEADSWYDQGRNDSPHQTKIYNSIYDITHRTFIYQSGIGDRGVLLNEDGTYLSYETTLINGPNSTIKDEVLYFVTEQSSQLNSFNMIAETGDRLVQESGLAAAVSSVGAPLLLDDALMLGQKNVTNRVGVTIGDLGDMMFTENYSHMEKIQQEGNTDDIMLESGPSSSAGNGGHFIQESPSEGIRISDISTLYPNKFVTGFLDERERKGKLTYSASVQTS